MIGLALPCLANAGYGAGYFDEWLWFTWHRGAWVEWFGRAWLGVWVVFARN